MMGEEKGRVAHKTGDQDSKVLALIFTVVSRRLHGLSADDLADLGQLADGLMDGQIAPDSTSLQSTVFEILSPSKGGVMRMDLSADLRPAQLQKWVEYIRAKIKGLRDKAGMTQMELADKSGLPQSHISRLEQG